MSLCVCGAWGLGVVVVQGALNSEEDFCSPRGRVFTSFLSLFLSSSSLSLPQGKNSYLPIREESLTVLKPGWAQPWESFLQGLPQGAAGSLRVKFSSVSWQACLPFHRSLTGLCSLREPASLPCSRVGKSARLFKCGCLSSIHRGWGLCGR